MALTAEELAMLTDEERAGYEEEEDEGDESDNPDDGAGDGAGDDDENNDAGDKPAGDDKTPSGGDDQSGQGSDDAGDGNGDADDQGDTANAPPPKPLFNAELPADLEAKRTDLNSKEDALIEKFDNGDLTFAEYNKELRSLNSERNKLDRLELKAELAQEAQQSQIDSNWDSLGQAFVNSHPLIAKNETMFQSFDAVLRRVTGEVMAKGQQPGQRELDKAYQQWTADLGIQADPATKTPPAPKARKENLVPPNLGKVPAATAADTDDGKWASLDRLADSDPLAFEAAMQRLTDAERDEYTRAG